VNGAASVLGTVAAMVLSISLGFRSTLWIGALAYALAIGFVALRSRALRPIPAPGAQAPEIAVR
jgi:hypothetical protein